MKRLIVFIGGLALIVAVALYVIPARNELAATGVIARVRVEGGVASRRKAILADECLRIVSPKVVGSAIKTGRLDQLPSYKDVDLAAVLQNELEATPWGRGDRVIEIRLNCASEADGKAALGAVVDAYVELFPNDSRDSSMELRAYIEQLVSQCTVTLKSQIAQHQELVAKSEFSALPNYETILQDRADAVSRRTRLLTEKEVKAASLRARASVLSAAVDKRDQEELLSLFALDDPNGREQTGAMAIIAKLLPLFQERKKVLKRVGKDHPDAVRITSQIASTREFLGRPREGAEDSLWDFIGTYVSSLQMHLSVLDSEIKELEGGLEIAQAELKGLSTFAIRERQLREAIETTKRQFDVLMKKIDSFDVGQQLNVEIVELPRLAQLKDERSHFGVFLALVGIVTVIALGRMANRGEPAPLGPVIRFPAVGKIGSSTVEGNVRQITAIVQLARYAGERNQVVVRAREQIANAILDGVAAELTRIGVGVQCDIDSGAFDETHVQLATTDVEADPHRVLYIDVNEADWPIPTPSFGFSA